MSSELLSVLNWLSGVELEAEPKLQAQARWLVLDTMGCIMAGMRSDSVLEFSKQASRADPGNFYFTSNTPMGLSASNAAMLLAMAASWDEACEGHAGAHGRPGVAAFAALLPMSSNLSYGQFLKSLVVGYEIGARLGASLRINPGMHVDGNWPALGAAAAVAHAFGLSPIQINDAIGLAACQLPMSLYLPVRWGSTARNTYLGHAAQLGQSAALSLASGLTVPPNAIGEYALIGLNKEPLPINTSQDFQVLQAYFKPYAAVRHVHYGALAAQTLRRSVEVEKIDRLVLRVYEEATVYCGNRAPQTPLQAQFSLSFGIAAMLRWGRLDPWVYREPQFQDAQLRNLETKVEIQVNVTLTEQLERGANLSIYCSDGTQYEQDISTVPGDAAMPFSESELIAKFLDYCEGSLSREAAHRLSHIILYGSNTAPAFQFWKSIQEKTTC